jgi:hypothetical protein
MTEFFFPEFFLKYCTTHYTTIDILYTVWYIIWHTTHTSCNNTATTLLPHAYIRQKISKGSTLFRHDILTY